MVTKQESVNRLSKTLVIFGGILIGWLLLDLLARIVDPAGLLSFLSGVLFVGAALSFVAVLVFAARFYTRIK